MTAKRRPALCSTGSLALFALFVLFLYGPMITIFVLSASRGPQGGLTFPMNGVSLHWFSQALGRAGRGRHLGGVPPLGRARRSS